jgi:uncharacterized protein
MRGMDRRTGAPLSDDDHIRQSVHDILTTPIGSRVMLREYGSDLPNLVDKPMNELFAVEIHASTSLAIERWEPRITFTQARISRDQATGRAIIDVEATKKADGSVITIEGISP